METSHVLQTLLRKKGAILLAALACAVLAGGASFRMGREYTAAATLKVRAHELLAPVDRLYAARPEEVEGLSPEAQTAQTQAMVKTVEAMVKSPGVLSPVIRALKLGMTPAELQSQIAVKEVSPVLVQVTVTDASADRAAATVNAVTESFARFASELRAGEAQRDLEATQAQVVVAQQELEQSQRSAGRNSAIRTSLAEANLRELVARQARLRDTQGFLRQSGLATVVDRAGAGNPPVEASGGRTLKLALAGLLLGGLAAAVMAVALEAFDRRVRTLPEAEALYGQPVLAVVPRAPADWDPRAVATAAGERPTSPLAEAIHFLALRVLRRAPEQGCLVLAGLAARPGQGATATLTNLAIALAQAGRRVALVDADLRAPSIHAFFDLPNGPGLSHLATGAARAEELMAATPVRNLAVVSAGAGVANPWELLRSPVMGQFLESLRGLADVVILNTPPAADAADALTMASYADLSLAVFRISEVPSAPEAALRDASREAGIALMGLVLNDVRAAEIGALRSQLSAPDRQPADLARPAFANRVVG